MVDQGRRVRSPGNNRTTVRAARRHRLITERATRKLRKSGQPGLSSRFGTLRNVDELASEITPGGGTGSWLFCFSCSHSRARPRSGSSLTSRNPGPTCPTALWAVRAQLAGSLESSAPADHAETPAPLVVFFHGGGFVGGDKKSVPGWLVTRCLAEGISVASVNYRLSTQSPFPAPMLDGARAIQFLRLKAGELGIDPGKIAACGNSAGAGISLWVGFHDDLADSSNADPVLRQSSRLACMGVVGAQTSYDPRFIKQLIGGRAHEHVALKPLFGVTIRRRV